MSLVRSVLREQIKQILLERILNGQYKPGERLIEMQIAQQFGTSQAPVRESLRELEALGFVESEPYRGTRVRAMGREELTEIYPVRAALEEVAARLAAVHLAGDVRVLEAEVEAMEQAAERGESYDLVQHDVAFHHHIVEAARNRVLLDAWKSLRIEARTLISFIASDMSLHELAERHRPVLEALRESNAEKAGHLLRQHVEYFGDKLFKEKPNDPPG